jgi:prolipoprotein diacylglyceryl transferase
MWLAFVAAYFVLRAETRRRRLPDIADNIVLWTALAGVLGAKIYHELQEPHELVSSLAQLRGAGDFLKWFSAGFAWFGGFLAVIATLLLLARHYKLRPLAMLDLCAPAAALGYAVGRIGCLVSGDGDYGVPTNVPWGMRFLNGLVPSQEVCRSYGQPWDCKVHPTPIYEFLFGVVLFWYLWRLGAKALRGPRPIGEVTAEYLLWSGVARFLVEFIRINPRTIFGHFSNAQGVAFLSALAGLILLLWVRRSFKSLKQEHRIVQHATEKGDVLQPEYHQPTPECPTPEKWRMYDSMTAEVEVLEFLKSLIMTVKPKLVVETGTFMGISTLKIAEGLKENGFGKVISVEYDPVVYAKAKERFQSSGLMQWIDLRNVSSLDLKVEGPIDLLFSDSEITIREQEVRHFLPQINPTGLILMHDASSHLKTVREAALKMESEGLISAVLMPTPRGLVIAQKREGRK